MAIDRKTQISAQVGEYAIPPLKDMLVLGRQAPIGCIAMRRAVELLVTASYEHIEIEDDVVSDILVRQRLLQRISRDKLIDFVLTHIKPMMGIDEVMHAAIDVKVFLTEGA